MTPRPRRVSDAEVLAATGRALSRTGPRGLTLSQVAAEAGIAPPTLLQRFGSKRGLLLAFAEGAKEGLRAAFAAARAGHASPREALGAALVTLSEPVATREAMANHLAMLQMDLADPDLHRHAVAHGRALRAEVRRLLEEAMEAGELPRGDAEALAVATQRMFDGALITWAVHGGGTVADAVRDALAWVPGGSGRTAPS